MTVITFTVTDIDLDLAKYRLDKGQAAVIVTEVQKTIEKVLKPEMRRAWKAYRVAAAEYGQQLLEVVWAGPKRDACVDEALRLKYLEMLEHCDQYRYACTNLKKNERVVELVWFSLRYDSDQPGTDEHATKKELELEFDKK